MSLRNSSQSESEDVNLEEDRAFYMKKVVKSNSILADTSLLREPDWTEWKMFAQYQEKMFFSFSDPDYYIEMNASLKNHSDLLIEANKYQRSMLTKDEIKQVDKRLPKMI